MNGDIEKARQLLVTAINLYPDLIKYLAHSPGCEIGQTDFCTCGMREAKLAYGTAMHQVYLEVNGL